MDHVCVHGLQPLFIFLVLTNCCDLRLEEWISEGGYHLCLRHIRNLCVSELLWVGATAKGIGHQVGGECYLLVGPFPRRSPQGRVVGTRPHYLFRLVFLTLVGNILLYDSIDHRVRTLELLEVLKHFDDRTRSLQQVGQ